VHNSENFSILIFFLAHQKEQSQTIEAEIEIKKAENNKEFLLINITQTVATKTQVP
jgi:hypothetical protein